MPLHPQAVAAIKIAGDLPAGLAPDELRRRYHDQRITMLPRAPDLPTTEEFDIPGRDGPIPVRFYRFEKAGPACSLLVFFHGGGWMLASLESYDTVCRRLAQKARCAVVSVGYRLAPESPFPAAVHDAYDATLWCWQNSARLGVDPARIAVGGDSAGGNLAAVVAQMALDLGKPAVASQILVYPATDLVGSYPSHERNATGYMLTTEALRWFIDRYVPDPRDRTDPRASPLLRPDLAGLPRALIISAEFDPLVDDNAAYARRLETAGVRTTCVCFPGMMHPFFTLGGLIDAAAEAEDLIATEMHALG
jgi:acetyl esterase